MRRIAGMLALCALLLPMSAWADPLILNKFGTVSITASGIVSRGSQLVSFFFINAPSGHSLGSVTFSTGALTSGSIWSGGTFASTGSTFDVVGVGPWAKSLTGCFKCTGPIALFTGGFIGSIKWTLVSQTGKYDYVFTLKGLVKGMLWGGRESIVPTTQTIYVDQNQWFHNHRGSIGLGKTDFRIGPEPGTLGLFGAGLIVIGAAMRRKLLGS